MFLAFLTLAACPAVQALPVVEVTADNTRIDESCLIRIAPGTVLADLDGNGVLHIIADGIRVEFEQGSVLRGAPPGTPGDSLEGIGVRLEGVQLVQLKNLQVEGFRCGVLATRCDSLQVEGGFLRRNFRQRLGSTPSAEDGADWLWPHENDAQQWRRNYGAGLCVEESRLVSIQGLKVRDQQNGIILDRVTSSTILQNDCSFLSGWGIAMWRSSENEVRENRLDYNVRGYSHGVYNRGQDSAGLLMFEQCSGNRIIANSATHCGDGIFAFSGKETLGEAPAPDPDLDYARRGNNDNLFVGNRLDFAVAHGLELTFGFGNTIQSNSFRGNGICGIWAGFSQETAILDNTFERNGEMGYGLERGGINIDHSRRNLIQGNRFLGDRCGVHLWSLGNPFAATPWGLANDLTAAGNALIGNRFEGVETEVHLRGTVEVDHHHNVFLDGEGVLLSWDEAFLLEEGATAEAQAGTMLKDTMEMSVAIPQGRGFGGRETILIGAWGPWDFESPLWQRMSTTCNAHLYRALPENAVVEVRTATQGGVVVTPMPDADGVGSWFRVAPTGTGFQAYSLHVTVAGQRFETDGSFLNASWTVRSFASPCDPREDLETWRAAAAGDAVATWQMEDLSLAYASGGPKDVAPQGIAHLPEAPDAFGTIATAAIQMPAGRWRIRVHSDDGVRLRAGQDLLIDNWTHHAPVWDTAEMVLAERQTVDFLVEHFELDGYALLEVVIEPVR